MADDTDESLAVRLSDVVFSYDRDADLPPAETFADSETFDPDERGGPVLRGIDLRIPAGSFTVVMGASGGGKSTLLRTFNAIIPDFVSGSFRGDVDVLGRDATETRVSEMAEVVGMVLQDYESQLFGTSVTAEVAFGPENLAVSPEEIDGRIERALDVAGLSDLDRQRGPDALSGGQKQRLVFAGVLANHPEFVVLDEPTSDLDPAGSRGVLSVVRSLAHDDVEADTADPADTADTEGVGDATATEPDTVHDDWRGPDTVALVTHKIEEALLADRAVLLRGGRVHRAGPAREVFTDVEALREARVAVPPVVEAFDRVGWDGDLPLTPDEGVEAVRESDLSWRPPAVAGEDLPGSPAGTGETPGEALFEIEGLVHEYDTDRGSVRAVDGVDLTVREGEVVAVVGHNGSGKTTLAKHLNGLLAPDEGSVTWRGQEVSALSMGEVGRSVGFVFQNPDHQIFADTVWNEVKFGPENFGLSGDELEAQVADAIETVELDGLEETDPFALSKGQRQRVALASILATDPDTLVFDEPTTGLDATQQAQFMELVARLNREQGLTVVMVTHSMGTVARYAPRTVVMADGRTVADRPTRELFADRAALDRWKLKQPQPVELSNRLSATVGPEDGLPALSVDEVVAGLGGDGAVGTTPSREATDGGDGR